MKKRITSLILAAVMVFALLPAMAFSVTAEDAVATTPEAYNALYVQDGLTMLLTAWNNDTSGVDLANGTWKNLAGGANATFEAGEGVSWVTRGSKGVGYDLTAAQMGAAGGSTRLSLPATLLANLAGYTVEYAGAALYTSENGVAVANSSYYTGYATEKLGAWGSWIFPNEKSARAMYHNYTYWNHGATWVGSTDTSLAPGSTVRSRSVVVVNYPDGLAVAWVKDANGAYIKNGNDYVEIGQLYTKTTEGENDVYTEDANGTYFKLGDAYKELSDYAEVRYKRAQATGYSVRTVYSNLKQVHYHSTQNNSTVNSGPLGTTYYPAPSTFFIMQNCATTLYAVRVYDRALTTEERNWNYFVDLLAYTGTDLSGTFAKLTDKQKETLAANYVGIAMEDVTAEALEKAMADLVAAAEALAKTWTEADKLYVTDGLTALYTAYGQNDMLDLAAGTWASKVDGQLASLFGGTYDAETNPVGWRKAADGSIYYRMHDIKEFEAQRNNVGITLPSSLVNDTDNLTMEAVFLALGIAKEDGTKVPHTGDTTAGESQWGAYNRTRSAFTLGGAQVCHFNYSTGTSGNNMNTRLFYAPGGWETSGVNPTTSNQGRVFGDVNGMSGKMDTLMLTRVFLDEKDANGNDQIQVTLKTTLNTVSVSNDKTKFPNKIPAGNITYKAEAFVGFPAQVYAIRVYNRTLTDAEKQQNHFADLANYFALDLTGLAAIEDKAALFAAFADKDFTADKAALQAELDAFTGAKTALTYEGLAARLSGNSGIRSLWSVDNAAIQALEDAGYTVSYGAIMGLVSKYAVSSDLTVEEGAGKAIVTVYNGGAYTGKILARDDAFTTFAYTTTFDGEEATKANYELKLVYRGFVTVTKGETTSTFYVDMAGETFPATGASCLDVAAYFLANGYADSEVLKAVKAICEAE